MPRYKQSDFEAALRDTHGMVFLAAKRLGCSYTTIRTRVDQSPQLREVLAHERGLTTDTAELKLYQAIINGEQWAVLFYLRTQGKDRGYVERHETSGPDGAPIAFTLNLGDATPTDD